jgi:hypothetical protein
MALELHDADSFDGSIGNTNSETLTVESNKADFAEVLIDDGTTGNAPAGYDIELQYYSTAVDDWMEVESQTGLTDNSPDIEDSCSGQNYRIVVTNSSGSSADYRISLESFKEI